MPSNQALEAQMAPNQALEARMAPNQALDAQMAPNQSQTGPNPTIGIQTKRWRPISAFYHTPPRGQACIRPLTNPSERQQLIKNATHTDGHRTPPAVVLRGGGQPSRRGWLKGRVSLGGVG